MPRPTGRFMNPSSTASRRLRNRKSCKPLDLADHRAGFGAWRTKCAKQEPNRPDGGDAGSRLGAAGLSVRSSIRDFAATIRSRRHWACRCLGCSPGGRSRDRLAKLPSAAQYLRPAFSYVRWFQGRQGATSAWGLRGWFMHNPLSQFTEAIGRCAWASNLPMSIARPRSCW